MTTTTFMQRQNEKNIVITRVITNMMMITFIQRQSENGIVVRTRRSERRERSKAQQPGPSGSAVMMIFCNCESKSNIRQK